MEDADKESKTESPTDKKISDAKEKGNVAFSRELPVIASILSFTLYFIYYSEKIVLNISTYLYSQTLNNVDRFELSKLDLYSILTDVIFEVSSSVGSLFLAITFAVFISSSLQGFPSFIGSRISPKFSRISPHSGFLRIYSMKGLVEFSKSVLKVVLAIFICWYSIKETLFDYVISMFQLPSVAIAALQNVLKKIFVSVCCAAALIAVLDFVWQKRSWWHDLKMTRQEIKDEIKQAEGDPIVKGRLRSLGRSRARNRMMKSVSTASLIIANPTHIAIALRYDRERDSAPVVVAVGADIIAQKIRAIADEYSVPVFERVELARALYKVVKVDQVIPHQFYRALAELIRIISK